MKIKIISDGTPQNTRVVNAETGEWVENVTRILWEQSRHGTTATIDVDSVAIEVATGVKGGAVTVEEYRNVEQTIAGLGITAEELFKDFTGGDK